MTDARTPPWIAENLGFLVARVGTASAALFRDRLAALDLRPKHYSVLSVLSHSTAPLTQQGVAGCLEIEPSSVVAVVDELEALELVRRVKDLSDRRRNTLVLTALGRTRIEQGREVAADVERALFGDLPAPERRQLQELLLGAAAAGTPVS
ncbi:MAG: MarR family winged helix-turn-helix transcriptional regulator [Pseudonocardia sp.]